MPPYPAIPPLLEPYLGPPPSGSLTLLTSTLGTSVNWLVLRYILAALKGDNEHGSSSSKNHGLPGDGDEEWETTKVVLVSWFRDENWWKEAGKKLAIPFQKVIFVDALRTSLGINPISTTTSPTPSSASPSREEPTNLAAVEHTILSAIHRAQEDQKTGSSQQEKEDKQHVAESKGHLSEKKEKKSKILLILDGLDFLLAATACPVTKLMDVVRELQENACHTIITQSADTPFIHAQSTPLETSHTALVMSIAHQAQLILSTRQLDTGVAKDVSGVLRVTGGAGPQLGGSSSEAQVQGTEFLYYVGPDSGVRVFERGS